MADKVIRLKTSDFIKHETRGDDVVLIVTGKCDGRCVRVELPLSSYAVQDVARCLREGVKYQANRWTIAQQMLGKEG